tara:strand:+ start:618 stop:1613 length:996 start_codon:yes stop_codon:yes gene_type:complete
MSQDTDFQIPNGTGQAVRLDLQTAILALASLSSGSQSGLGTTQPCQLFADTTNGLLKIRDTGGNAAAAQATFHTIGSLNTANLGLLPRSGGTMTGVITGSTGSAAAPSINFGDSSTGIFKESTNVLGITGAGNLSFTFSNTSFNLRDQRPARFFDSDSSNYIEIKAPSTVSSSNKTLTLPDETGTLLTDQTTSLAVTTVTTTNTRTTNVQDSSGNNGSTAVQIQQGRAKAWVNFNGQGTVAIRDDFNVSSITDIATGDFRVNFDTSMPSVNYCVATQMQEDHSTSGGSGARPLIRRTSDAIQTGSVRTTHSNVATGAGVDPLVFTVTIFGD